MLRPSRVAVCLGLAVLFVAPIIVMAEEPADPSGQVVTIVLPVGPPKKAKPAPKAPEPAPTPAPAARRRATAPTVSVQPTAPPPPPPPPPPVRAHGGRSAPVASPSARGGLSTATIVPRSRRAEQLPRVAALQEPASVSSAERVPRWLLGLVAVLALGELLFLARLAYRRRATRVRRRRDGLLGPR